MRYFMNTGKKEYPTGIGNVLYDNREENYPRPQQKWHHNK